ncbi:HET-domain-containing protein [Setomelanomma holmii]|uniref:HET-domain-containing protein n=1 Tax=Setomelanomma holmii TaxID=210430 RepID=A0A9P4LJY7_9PLEO|nr:HET-domain-containing protein [Setomelanomma holmii]
MWISHCDKSHECWSIDNQRFVPPRLLDLRAFDHESSLDLKLIARYDAPANSFSALAHYATLSHCWGDPAEYMGRAIRPVTTTKHNLSDRMSRIAFNTLSRTFSDAVSIARQLSLRYLWIDSLRIIQDDEADWARESSLMDKVYGNSYCTLAALSSRNGDFGCRQAPYLNMGNLYPTAIMDISKDSVRFRPFRGSVSLSSWDKHYDGTEWYEWSGRGKSPSTNSPLRYRAWTMQEGKLSRRVVYFGKDQLLWSCRQLKATAQLPWQEARTAIDSLGQIKPSDWNVSFNQQRAEDKWYTLVEDFMSRSLTCTTDRLPALSRLAREFQYEFPTSRYVAGMWTEHLPGSLLWYNTSKNCTPMQNIRGSFLVLGLPCQVEYE